MRVITPIAPSTGDGMHARTYSNLYVNIDFQEKLHISSDDAAPPTLPPKRVLATPLFSLRPTPFLLASHIFFP